MNRRRAETSNASRLQIVDTAGTAERAGVGALDPWAFVVPAVSFIEIAIVGRLIVSEILRCCISSAVQ